MTRILKKIPSFQVNHIGLKPGIYISRIDQVGDQSLVTYDLRMSEPNAEPVMNTAEIHTLEHLGATFLRNHPIYEKDIIYFGPMGCRTGFYFIIKGNHSHQAIYDLILEFSEFTIAFEGDIPGASAQDCGNYLDQNLGMAKYQMRRYREKLLNLADLEFKYAQDKA